MARALQLPGSDLRNMSLPVLLIVLSSNLKGLRIDFEQGKFLGEGDPCSLPNNGTGVCARLFNCPTVVEKIQAKEEPIICSFDQFTSFVCCPQDGGSTQQRAPDVYPLTPAPEREQTVARLSKSQRACARNHDIMLRVSNSSQSKGCEEVYYEGPGVVGGEDAFPKEFPHMAALGYGKEDSIEWVCGGALISERYVLTAAHCAVPRRFGTISWVRLGDLDLKSSTDDSRPQQFSVVDRIVHPEYKHPALYNDIALLRLDRDVTFDNYVRPACLNTEDDLSANVGEATGWGLTKSFGPPSSILQKATLPVQPKEECERNFQSSKGTIELMRGFDDSMMLCVGDRQGEMDTCKGDSGGPYHKEKDPNECVHIIAGITSFGKPVCAAVNSPAVYTRVSMFVPWIESVVWPGQ